MPGIACEASEVNGAVRGRRYRCRYASARTDRDVTIDPSAYVWFGGLGKGLGGSGRLRLFVPRHSCLTRDAQENKISGAVPLPGPRFRSYWA
jgi:hypothetical protein